MGHSTLKTVKKDVLAASEEAEMFQPTELNSIVSGSKLWDYAQALLIYRLCTNAMPCFRVAVPIICKVYSLIWYPTSTDRVALLLLL